MMKDHLNIENSVRANHGGGLQTKAAKEEFAAALKKAGVPDRATIKAALISQRDEEKAGATVKPLKSETPKQKTPKVSDEKITAAFNRSVENVSKAQAEVDRLADAHWSDPRVRAASEKLGKAMEAATLLRQSYHAVDREAFLRAAGERKKMTDRAAKIDKKASDEFERSPYNAFNLPDVHPIRKMRDEAAEIRKEARMGPGTRMNAAYYGEPKSVGKLTSDGGGKVNPAVPSNLPSGGAKKELKEFLEGSDVVMAFNPRGFSRFVSEGEAKNGFSPGTGGIKVGKGGYLEGRQNGEKKTLGIPESADAKDRPVYAALEHPDRAKSLQGGAGNQMSNYGGIQVVLNSSVKDRSTFTVGDSLDYSAPRGIMASPVRDPADPVRAKGKGKGKLVDLKTGEENHSGRMEIRSGMEDDKTVVPSYVEAQIHGGLKTSDIKEVRYYKGNEIPQSTRKLLEDQGVKIVELPPKMGELRIDRRSPNFKDITTTEPEQ